VSTPLVEIVRCGVGDQAYALEMVWVRGVDRADRLHERAGLDGSVGALNDASGEIPVFSFARQIGRSEFGIRKNQHVIILNGSPRPLAVLVDDVSPVIRVPARSLMPLPAIIAGATAIKFRGLIEREQELLLLMDPEQLIPVGTLKRVHRGGRPAAASVWEPEFRQNPGLERRRSAGGQVVIFSTAESVPSKRPLSFGLSMTQVLEVLDLPPFVPVPGTPEYFLGVAAWHDRPVAVVDLASRVGLPRFEPDARTRLLVARASYGSEPVGFVVRPSIRVLRLPLPHLPCTQAPPLDPALTLSALELNSETLVIPNLATITGGC
jgi:chemotaxis signal transduction protein